MCKNVKFNNYSNVDSTPTIYQKKSFMERRAQDIGL